MSFSDLLKAPLPSKSNPYYTESEDPTLVNADTDTSSDKDMPDTSEVPGGEVSEGGCNEGGCVEDGDSSMVSDTGAVLPNVKSPIPDTDPDGCTGPECDTLTPDESQRVDDVMNTVATPMLLADELKDNDAMKEFVESIDSDIAIAEGFLTEKTIIKFDKNAKRAQLYEVAVAAVAREKNDPLYRKLETVYKMERILKAKLRKKYHSQANAKVKEYLARAKKSKSGLLSRIAKKISGGK